MWRIGRILNFRTKKHTHQLIGKKSIRVSYQPKYELHRIKWEINPYDADKNENWSIPHGDDIYPHKHTLKLNVYTGEIIKIKNRKLYGRLTKKELERLHSDEQFRRVVQQAVGNSNTFPKLNARINCSYIFESYCVINKVTRNRRTPQCHK